MNQEFKASLKSADTEEHIDIYFYRPIGYQWARFFRMLHVTPNVVTILSIFLGVGAGICFYFDDLAINILGIFLLIWANVYDSCDGQLARLTNQKSALGRILDGAAGDFWFVSIYFAISFRLMPEWGWKIWALCIVAGFGCHAIQSRLADYYRQIHLFFLKGKEGSELDDAMALGADCFITGEIRHHEVLDAVDKGCCVIEAGHFETENPVCEVLAAALQNAADALQYNLTVFCLKGNPFGR